MNENFYSVAQAALLEPTGLTDTHLDQFMHQLSNVDGCDFADLYFQYSKQESWSLDEGVVKSGSFNIDQGVGLRSVCGEKTAFAYSEDLNAASILAATDVVQAIGRSGQNAQMLRQWKSQTVKPLYIQQDPLAAMGQSRNFRESR